MARNFQTDDRALTARIRDGQAAVLAEDLDILEAQQGNILRRSDRQSLDLKIDAGGVHARRIMDRELGARQPKLRILPKIHGPGRAGISTPTAEVNTRCPCGSNCAGTWHFARKRRINWETDLSLQVVMKQSHRLRCKKNGLRLFRRPLQPLENWLRGLDLNQRP